MSENNILNATGITTTNIDSVIKSLRKQLQDSNPIAQPTCLYFPRTVRGELDRKKYKGCGRPRKDDYKRIDMMKLLKKYARN